jgi:cobalamin biosynthesis Mg chelatase CobN
MKVTKLLYAPLLIMALNSCKVHKEVQKNSSRVDSTTTSSKEVAKGTSLLQQNKNNRLDSSHTSGKNKYQRQTVSYQFAPDTNRNKGNGTGLFPPALENRLTGITVTNEEGTQATQTGSLTRQNTDLLNIAKDSSKSEEKKSSVLNKAQEEQHSKTTRTGGWFPWWLILLIIALILLAVWKGRPIVLFIRAVIRLLRNGMPPNTPA